MLYSSKTFCISLSLIICVTQSTVIFNIKDDGAIGDGTTDNTDAIRRTLRRAADSGEPSTVLIPAGDFLTGALQLPSNVTLRLEAESILRASDNASLYTPVPSTTSDTGPFDFPFLLIDKSHNVRIEGEGLVDAGANSPPGHLVLEYHESSNMLMPIEWNLTGCTYFSCRPKLCVVRQSSDISFINVTLANSPLWTITVVESEQILFDGVTIIGDRRWPNNDGIDLINTRHTIIRNSNITTGDDCIAIVSHGPLDMFNITVENMDLQSTSAAIKISAFEPHATANMHSMVFRDLRITDSNRGICIAPRWGSGTISDFLFEKLTIETRFFGLDWWGTGEPLYITSLSMRNDRPWNGTVRNIVMRNIVAKGEEGIFIVGNTSILYDIQLENISLTISRWSNQSAHPTHDYRPSIEPQMFPAPVDGIYAYKVEQFALKNISIEFQPPLQNYYGQCLNLSNFTQAKSFINVDCKQAVSFGLKQINSFGLCTTMFILILNFIVSSID